MQELANHIAFTAPGHGVKPAQPIPWRAKERRARCIEHSLNLASKRFLNHLGPKTSASDVDLDSGAEVDPEEVELVAGTPNFVLKKVLYLSGRYEHHPRPAHSLKSCVWKKAYLSSPLLDGFKLAGLQCTIFWIGS